MKRSRGLTDPVFRANKGKMSSKIRFNLIGTAQVWLLHYLSMLFIIRTLNWPHRPYSKHSILFVTRKQTPKAKVLHCTTLKRLASDKHCSLMDHFISQKKMKCYEHDSKVQKQPDPHFTRYLTAHLSICPSVHLSICPSVHLSICPSVHLSICPLVCPSTHLSDYLSLSF